MLPRCRLLRPEARARWALSASALRIPQNGISLTLVMDRQAISLILSMMMLTVVRVEDQVVTVETMMTGSL